MLKIVQLTYGTVIQTKNLLGMNLLSWPLDQGSRQSNHNFNLTSK